MPKKQQLVSIQQIAKLLSDGDSAVTSKKIVAEIAALINRFIESGKRPLYVYCHATGRKCAMTAIDYFNKKKDQYGGIVQLMTQYRGRVRAAAARRGGGEGTAHRAGQFKAQATCVHKTDKKGEPLVLRQYFDFTDGRKVVRDYDVETGEYTYIKGDRKMLFAV